MTYRHAPKPWALGACLCLLPWATRGVNTYTVHECTALRFLNLIKSKVLRLRLLVRRPLLPEERPRVKGVDLMWYDITGNEDGIEYQILDTSNATHIKVRGAQL